MLNYKTAGRIVGALFLISTAGYAVGNSLIETLRNAPDYLALVADNEVTMITGMLLMLVNCFAVVGLAVVMYPILKRYSETIACLYLSGRIIECVVLIFGVISYLAMFTISEQYAKLGAPEDAYFNVIGVVAKNGNYYAFQIGMIALSLGSLFWCYLLYQTRLIPRFFAAWGFIGYVALLVGTISALYGYDISMVTFVPGGLFELILPFWLFFKGFNLSPQSLFKNDSAANIDGAPSPVVTS